MERLTEPAGSREAAFADTLVIHRPVADVFAFMSDPSRTPEWDTGILEAHQASSGPLSAGTTVEATRALLGRRLALRCQIEEFEPDRAFTLAFRPFGPVRRMAVRYTFEPESDGEATRLTKVTQIAVGGPLKPLRSFFMRLARRENLDDLRNVQRVLETSAR